jgi:hypothetical protein
MPIPSLPVRSALVSDEKDDKAMNLSDYIKHCAEWLAKPVNSQRVWFGPEVLEDVKPVVFPSYHPEEDDE